MRSMRSRRCKWLILSLVSIFALPPAVWGAPLDSKSEIENLRRRIEVLEAEKTPAFRPFSLTALGKMLTFGGLLELEANYGKTEGGGEASDIVLATVELSTTITIDEHIEGHVILLWEEDDTEPIDVDEAVIDLSCPLSLLGQAPTFAGGKMYLPFGMFNSFFITDPLTLDLGESNNTAAVFGLEGELWTLKAGVFNGDTDTAGDNDNLDSWVAALTLAPMEGLMLGASFISDIAESDIGLVASEAGYASSVAGGALFASLGLGRFSLELEYVTALDDFDRALVAMTDAAGEPITDLTGRRPAAWNAELAWIPAERWQLGAKVEGADDFQEDVMRYGAVASHGIFENTVIGLEYLFADTDAEAQDKSHTFTMQLAFQF